MAYIAIRRSVAAVAGVLCVAGVLVWASAGRVGRALPGGRVPGLDGGVSAPAVHSVVVAELFTSEGCSTCPPADEVLGRLVHEPVGGIVVLGLGEHVDYWDRLGWRDRFSSPVFSKRQSEYQAQGFGMGIIYTPQLVIDGQFETRASDLSAVRGAIVDAAKIPKAAIELAASVADAGHLKVRVHLQLPSVVAVREQADVVVALTEDHLTNDVRSGENRGRRLEHSAVVRSLTTLGSLKPPIRTFEATVTVPVAADWNLGGIRIIGLLQERLSRRIVGAGSARVNTHEAPSSAG